MIRQKESENKKEEKNTKKYNYQGQSERSGYCFDLDHEWLEENFRTRESYFYKFFKKKKLGVMIKKRIKYLEYQLVM